jgi:ABC-type bacteriocin/lantibiotic exporter with double-glycine peptidase domain
VTGAIAPARRAARALVRAALLLALPLSGCVRVPSNARPIAAGQVAPERGWIAVAGIQAVRQRSALDCGPAALAAVAQHWGVDLSRERAARAAARQPGRGTRLGRLRAIARASGLTAFAVRADPATLRHELERGRPVLVGLLRGSGRRRLSHYEVVVGIHPRRGEVATIDPASGFTVRRWAELAREWDPAGRPALIVIGRSGPRRASRAL